MLEMFELLLLQKIEAILKGSEESPTIPSTASFRDFVK